MRCPGSGVGDAWNGAWPWARSRSRRSRRRTHLATGRHESTTPDLVQNVSQIGGCGLRERRCAARLRAPRRTVERPVASRCNPAHPDATYRRSNKPRPQQSTQRPPAAYGTSIPKAEPRLPSMGGRCCAWALLEIGALAIIALRLCAFVCLNLVSDCVVPKPW